MSTQALLQATVPAWQFVEQVPAAHTSVEVQTLLHAPQLVGSLAVLTHTPLHNRLPVGQLHAPPAQD